MKKHLLLLFSILVCSHFPGFANEPDSAYIFAYSTVINNGGNGLHYAWSIDGEQWHGIGPEYRFLFSDYGNWGEQKKMQTPFLYHDGDGKWHCIWSLNKKVGQFAYASSSNLYEWEPQAYPYVMEEGNVLMPEILQTEGSNSYTISWLNIHDESVTIYKTTTTDFKTFTKTSEGTAKDRIDARKEVKIDGKTQTGTLHKVQWKVIDQLIKRYEWSQYRTELNRETVREDDQTYAGLETLNAEITILPDQQKSITDKLIGIFFEDINYAADGGLYAELVQNRGFEYTPADTKFRDQNWNSYKSWSYTGETSNFTIDTLAPIHPNQKHYAVLQTKNIGDALVNEGFGGIPVMAGEKYIFSVFAKNLDGTKGKLEVSLLDAEGNIVGKALTKTISANWKKVEVTIKATKTCNNAKLAVAPQVSGKMALDMISLFPEKTFKGHRNGLRADLAQTLADMHPRFIRFPGGCVTHGDGIDNIYKWKNTVGPLETRKPDRNIWNYHQSMGLGYFEYFQFCEDIGAEPLPVIAAGVPCQNSSTGGYGQQGGVPLCDMDHFVQDILDLIEWANGDKNTKWGKIRAEAGHPEPFNLKYVGVGNEDLITDIFAERFTLIYKAIKEEYPEIEVVGTVGPFSEGSDYVAGWKLASELNVPLVDEHYYQPPGWFINNQDYYDRYDRSKPKVYLGEYAAHVPGRRNNIETALAEALYLTNVERNGDVVSMTSYAPLLAKEGNTQWNPDLIYFNNTEVKPTVGYYVQKLYGQNSGETYISSQVKLSDPQKKVAKRVGVSVVKQTETGDIIIKLVNVLPVKIDAVLHLSDLNISEGDATLTVLQGEIDDRKAKPATSEISISGEMNYTLPPYSFSVIRIKNK